MGHLTYSASKLWNTSNYEILENKTSIYELKVKLKDNLWYKNLHSQSAQAVIEKPQTTWKNCFKKYTKRPKYRPKDGHLTVIWKKIGIRLITLAIDLGVS
ncbi:MAG TPA: transposase, partial [Thermotogaceae bacterium]|nr:transposase [Thermotogaceae bacterium]